MAMKQAQAILKQPFMAGFWLILALPITATLILGIGEVFGMQLEIGLGDPLLIFIFGAVHFLAAYLWSRSLFSRLGLADNNLANVAAGIAFALTVVSGEIFGLFDIVVDTLGIRGNVPLEFAVYFIPWNGIVAGLTGSALGLGLKNWKLALKLLGVGLATGMIIFAAFIFVMGLFGFHVGTPRPDRIPSMPVITVLGVWTTALVGTHLFGKLILGAEFAETNTYQSPVTSSQASPI